jgi:Fic family protein
MIFQTPPPSFDQEAAIRRIEELWSDLRYFVAEPRRWFGPVRRVLAARAIQGSNSIEGYNVSVEDALAAIEGEGPTDSEWENWQAVSGYRRALTYVLQLARDQHFEYTSHLIRSLHFMMTEHSLDHQPGLWRQGPVWVRNDATGEIVYEGPEHGEVPGLVNELVAELASDNATPAIVRAAMAHLNLVMIHPFRDGNGRMSRCLQTLVLTREGILPKEFSSIEEYLGRNTEPYYSILGRVGGGRWSPERDATPWVRFCLEAHYIQAASVLRRVRESETMWRQIEELRERHGLPERSMAALFDAALGFKIRNASYRAALRGWDEEISNQVATSDLKGMVNAGLLRQFGAKRGTYYEAGDPLNRIREEVQRGREPISAESLFDLAA